MSKQSKNINEMDSEEIELKKQADEGNTEAQLALAKYYSNEKHSSKSKYFLICSFVS
jgi:hypothetical protein